MSVRSSKQELSELPLEKKIKDLLEKVQIIIKIIFFCKIDNLLNRSFCENK